MSAVKLTVAKGYETQMVMHTGTRTSDVSLTRKFQKHLSTAELNHGVIDQGIFKKRANKRNLTEREYHVQNDSDVAHKDVKMFWNTNQFP